MACTENRHVFLLHCFGGFFSSRELGIQKGDLIRSLRDRDEIKMGYLILRDEISDEIR